MAHCDPFADMWGGARAELGKRAVTPTPKGVDKGIGAGASSLTPRGTKRATSPSTRPRSVSVENADLHVGADDSRHTTIADRMYKRLSEGQPSPRKKGPAGVSGPASRPMLKVCYLCGQQFGTASLDIHQPQCYVKKLLQWERNPSEFRGAKPLTPEEFNAKLKATGVDPTAMKHDSEAFNDAQFNGYTAQLVPCANCGRTFLPDRLEVHARSCKGPGRGSKPVAKKAATPAPNSPQATATAEPTSAEADRTPAGSAAFSSEKPLRAPPPGASASPPRSSTPTNLGATRRTSEEVSAPAPKAPPATAKRSSVKAESAPRVSIQDRIQASLVRCQYCNRTFAPDRLSKHESVCLAQKTVTIARSSSFAKPANGESTSPVDQSITTGTSSTRTSTEMLKRTSSTLSTKPAVAAAARTPGAPAAKPKPAPKAKGSKNNTHGPPATLSAGLSEPGPEPVSPPSGATAGAHGAPTSPLEHHSHSSSALAAARFAEHRRDSTKAAAASPALEASFSELETQLKDLDSRRRDRGRTASSPNLRPAEGCGSPPGFGDHDAESPQKPDVAGRGSFSRADTSSGLHSSAAAGAHTAATEAKATGALRFCPECGAKLVDGVPQRFCCHCGTKLPSVG